MASRVTNEQLLEEIKKSQGNGEIRQLKALLPNLEVVAGTLAPIAGSLQRLAIYAEVLVADAQATKDREVTFRTLARWFKLSTTSGG
jgi:hypothetical protein